MKLGPVHYSPAGATRIHCQKDAPEWKDIRFTSDKADVTCPECLVAQLREQNICQECGVREIMDGHSQHCEVCSKELNDWLVKSFHKHTK